MTITQTIEIPVSRLISLPPEVPAGMSARIDVTWPPAEIDATAYLLSNSSNRECLVKAVKDISGQNLISFANVEDAEKSARIANKLVKLQSNVKTEKQAKQAAKLAEKLAKLIVKKEAAAQ